MQISTELQLLQEKFSLSDIYIIDSLNGFNAFSLDKLSPKVLMLLYDNTNHVDKDFIKYGLKRGFITLRMGADKHFLTVLESEYNIYKKSLPHKWFFSEIMKFPILNNGSYDKEKAIIFTMFPSNKHGFPIEWFRGKFNDDRQ